MRDSPCKTISGKNMISLFVHLHNFKHFLTILNVVEELQLDGNKLFVSKSDLALLHEFDKYI